MRFRETFPRGGVCLPYIRAVVKRLLAILMFVALAPFCARAADVLSWDVERNRVDAEISTWTVPQLLQRVSAVTGWQVLIDPSINEVVPTKFKGKNPNDALQRLLGKINYALAPETNGAPRLFVYRTSRNEATQTIAPMVVSNSSTNKGRIENELIVTLKPGEKIEDLAKRLGAKVVGKIEGMNAYRLRFDDASAAQSAKSAADSDSSVASTEYNYAFDRPEGTLPLGGAAQPLGLTPRVPPDGQYVIVGLIDTAVQGREGGISDFLLPGLAVAGESTGSKELSHGTAMAETILRSLSLLGNNNTSVRILPVDVYGAGDSSSTFDVAKGVYEAVNNGAKILNLSLGYTSPDGTQSGGPSSFLYNTLKSAYDQGVKIFAAAGNDGSTRVTLPAGWDFITAVTATDPRTGKIATYANRGDFVDVAAPGTSIVNYNGQAHAVTGTSTATAYVSGKAAAQAEAAKAAPKK